MNVFFKLFLPVLYLSSCNSPEGSEQAGKDLPNILLIMCDDQGWFDARFNGNRQIKTPHSDALAAQGVILNRFYSASAVCSPTRASVMTGRNPYRLGIPGANTGPLRNGWAARTDNSETIAYGTSYWKNSDVPIKVTENLRGVNSKIIMDRVLDFIGNAEERKAPFFATVWFHTPHLPVVSNEEYRNMYPGMSL